MFYKQLIASIKRPLLVFTPVLFSGFLAHTQEIKIKTTAPDEVNIGEEFRLSFTINRTTEEIRLDSLSDDFKLISGPTHSSQVSVTSNNGEVTKTQASTFQYELIAQRTGYFKLPGATILLGQVKHRSDFQKIKVVEKDTSTTESEKDTTIIFAKIILSKEKVFKYEPVRVQIKLYANKLIQSINNFNVLPEDDFLYLESNPETMARISLDSYNNQNYYSALLKDYILYPTKKGNFSIGSFEFECRVKDSKNKKTPTEQIFQSNDPMFSMILSDSATVTVQDYPEKKPDDFSYISGQNIQVSVSLDQPKVKANEPFKYQVKVSGYGNLKLLGTPEVDFPKNIYLIKTEYDNHLEADSLGIHGERTFTYHLFSDKKGEYEIPSFSFSYFNLKEQKFQQIASPTTIIKVGKNDANLPEPKVQPDPTRNEAIKYASLILLDLSESMMAEDLKPNRKTVVLKGIKDYVLKTKQNIGVIAYSRVPHLLAPLTDDKKSVIDGLNHIDTLNLGQGTSTGMTLCMGLDEIHQAKAEYKSIILITDDEQNYGTISENLAIDLSKSLGVPVNIIGIGGSGSHAPLTVQNHNGKQRITVPIQLNDEKLKKWAESTGGQYFRAINLETLENALKQIDQNIETTNKNKDSTYDESEIQHIINAIKQDILEEKEQLGK